MRRVPGLSKSEILKVCEAENVRFMRLQFTDIFGVIKNVELPSSQFGKALDGEIQFDGSSIEGFTRIEESDMNLVPDLSSFAIYPWAHSNGEKVGRLICDVYNPDGTPFPGCPRMTLKKQMDKASALGYTMVTGPEAEFFLFRRDANGDPIVGHTRRGRLFRPDSRRSRRGGSPGHRVGARADGLRGGSRPPRGRARDSTRSTSSMPTP
jgi:glutamine synthetase